MKLRRHSRAEAEVEAASLSDILFILMMFFLMISTMISVDAIKVNLPKISKNKFVSKDNINVYLTSEMKYYVQKTPVPLEQLSQAVENEVLKYPNPNVLLKVDETVDWSKGIELIDIIKQLQKKLKENKKEFQYSIATEGKK
jgi:biopolymer transport protein ExbD